MSATPARGARPSAVVRALAAPLLAVLLAAGCTVAGAARDAPPSPAAATTATLQGDDARPAAARWVRSELYFGVGLADDAGPAGGEGSSARPADREAAWRAFLDREVTSRFPDGLTVFDAYGQWLSRGRAAPERLRSKVLVILHEDSPRRRQDIEAIRLAWKRETGDQSVLLVRQPVEVSF